MNNIRTQLQGRLPFLFLHQIYESFEDFLQYINLYGISKEKVDLLDYQTIMQLYGNFESKYVEQEQAKIDAALNFVSVYENYEHYKSIYAKDLEEFMSLGGKQISEQYIGDYNRETKTTENNFSAGKQVNTLFQADMLFLRLGMNENPRVKLYREFAESIVYPLQRGEQLIKKGTIF